MSAGLDRFEMVLAALKERLLLIRGDVPEPLWERENLREQEVTDAMLTMQGLQLLATLAQADAIADLFELALAAERAEEQKDKLSG